MKLLKIILWVVFFTHLTLTSFAQGEGEDGGFEYSFHMGRLLPNQVPGATEILPQWGLRLGYTLPTSGLTAETGVITGSGEGVSWNTLHVSIRADMKVEDLLGIFILEAMLQNIQVWM